MLGKIGKQFKCPSEFLGRIASFVMKKGNMKEYEEIV